MHLKLVYPSYKSSQRYQTNWKHNTKREREKKTERKSKRIMNCEKWQNARDENTNELIKWLFSFDSSTKKVFDADEYLPYLNNAIAACAFYFHFHLETEKSPNKLHIINFGIIAFSCTDWLNAQPEKHHAHGKQQHQHQQPTHEQKLMRQIIDEPANDSNLTIIVE